MTGPDDTDRRPPGPEAHADWAAVRALFDQLQALPEAQRSAALQASGAEPAVRAEVASLLAHAGPGGGDTDGFLATPARAETPPVPSRLGQRLGPWRITGALGRGGMGEVWAAVRDDGAYDGQAAIKVLQRGLDSASVLARFAQEQRVLARLNHPHIAHLMDAGRTADGLPYFVMEVVHGRPIDQACSGLPVAQRLHLFLQLADAVGFAHRQLLVHRDLKPSNVLVTAEGSVKLLDFGIAKAIDPLDGELGHRTVAGERPFTPHYASPEQVRGEPVGTGTDLYSLGVLLYVMLTGIRPYGRHATNAQEAARSVLEEEPTRPSALSPGLVADPQWLSTRKRLAGDLDNILLKALDKRPEHRYPSVDALATDIRAHLTGQPVSARAATPAYLLGKLLRRNPVASGASLLAVLALLGGTALATWQAREARAQRAVAEQRFNEVRRFARTMLFDVDTALRDGPTAGREKLVQTSLEYLDRLSAERLSDRTLLRDLAEAYERVGDIQGGTMQANLGRPKEAQASFAKALALRERLAAQAPDDLQNLAGLMRSHERLGDQQRSAGALPQAAQHYDTALRHASTLAQAQTGQAGELAAQLKRIETARYRASVDYWPFHASLGRYAPARQRIEALVQELDGLLARHPAAPEVLEHAGGLLNQLTDFQRIAGEYGATLVTQQRSHALAQRLLATAPANPRWQRWLYLAEGRLADALMETGQTEAGIAMWQTSINRREAAAAADPGNERAQRNLANGYGPLAEQLHALGRHAQALAWYQRENTLLHTLVARYPQVAALQARRDESDRDLARQLLLTGQTGQAVVLQRQLDARRGAAASAAPSEEDAAKFALVRAQVLLGAPGTPAAERPALLDQARQGLAVLQAAAAAETFNALNAREAALATLLLAQLLTQSPQAGPRAEGQALRQQAQKALQQLAAAGRLPATVPLPT